MEIRAYNGIPSQVSSGPACHPRCLVATPLKLERAGLKLESRNDTQCVYEQGEEVPASQPLSLVQRWPQAALQKEAGSSWMHLVVEEVALLPLAQADCTNSSGGEVHKHERLALSLPLVQMEAVPRSWKAESRGPCSAKEPSSPEAWRIPQGHKVFQAHIRKADVPELDATAVLWGDRC